MEDLIELNDQADRPSEIRIGTESDGLVILKISPDKMACHADFIPPNDPKTLFVQQDIIQGISGCGIVIALEEDNIHRATFNANTQRKPLRDILVAKGKAPVKETPAHLNLVPHLFEHSFRSVPKAKENESVDHKTLYSYQVVKKGELLAKAVPAIPGSPGNNIYGEEIPFTKKEMKILTPGDHTIWDHGKVLAGISGQFLVNNNVFNVSPVLELENGVGYGSGHVIFPGEVHIGGPVTEGFRLVSGGDIICSETLDATEVLCGKNLEVQGGIIGHGRGLIRAEGHIESRFIENSQVEALGNITVEKSVFQSKVFTLGEFILEEGKLMSGEVQTMGNALVGQLGGPGAICRIILGRSFVLERKVTRLKSRYQVMEKELDRLSAEAKERIMELQKAMTEITQEINRLQQEAISSHAPELVVSGAIFPGCEIEIGYFTLKITQSMKSKRFCLADDGVGIMIEDHTSSGKS